MDIKIIEESKNKLVLESDTPTITALLKKELWNDSHLLVSGEKMRHPLIGKPTLVVETDGKESPKDALKEAVKRVKQELAKAKKGLK